MYLCAKGIQDTWVNTRCPDFSHFIYNFRRHTPFGIDFSDIPFTGNPNFGEIITCRVPSNKSDLLNSVSLTVNFTKDYDAMTTVGNPITKLIEYAELIIGEQVIDRITGEYIYLRQKLDTSSQHDAIKTYRGGEGTGTEGYYQTKFSVELPFYFTRVSKNAIPLCKLTKQQVSIRVKLTGRNTYYESKSVSSNLPPIYNTSRKLIDQIFLTTENVYLSDIERGAFQDAHMEYLITQVQLREERIPSGVHKKAFLLDFRHPTKEILFLGEPYPVPDAQDKNNNFIFRQIKTAELCLNNVVFFKENGHHFSVVQPFKNHRNIPDTGENEFGVYSFSLDPDSNDPAGHINFSRIIHQKFTIEFKDRDRYVDRGNNTLTFRPVSGSYAAETRIRVFALNYNILSFDSGLAGLKFS